MKNGIVKMICQGKGLMLKDKVEILQSLIVVKPILKGIHLLININICEGFCFFLLPISLIYELLPSTNKYQLMTKDKLGQGYRSPITQNLCYRPAPVLADAAKKDKIPFVLNLAITNQICSHTQQYICY